MRNKTVTAVAVSLLLSAPLVTAHITKESATAPDPVTVAVERTVSSSPAPEPIEQPSTPTAPKPSPKPTKTEAVKPAPKPEPTPTQDPTPTWTPEPEPTYEPEPATPDVEYYEVPVEYSSYEPEPSPDPEPTYTEEVYVEPTYIEEDEYVEESPEPIATETEEPVYDPRWDTVAECESGGDWSINTGNSFYGGVQFSKTSWDAMDGQEFAAYPHQASKEEQIIVAERLLEVQGWGAWPVCGAGY